jgi:diguanylate cyclase (GGDEF)-like protein
MRRHVRFNIDIPARYGGEEFAIILPEQSASNARVFAERLRRVVEKHKFPGQKEPLHVTISVGVGSYPKDATDKQQLIYLADQALYHAKEHGRNRVSMVADLGDRRLS